MDKKVKVNKEIMQMTFRKKLWDLYSELREAHDSGKTNITKEKAEYENLKAEMIEFYRNDFRKNDEYKRTFRIVNRGIEYYYIGIRHGMKIEVEDFMYKTQLAPYLGKIEKIFLKIDGRENGKNERQGNIDRNF